MDHFFIPTQKHVVTYSFTPFTTPLQGQETTEIVAAGMLDVEHKFRQWCTDTGTIETSEKGGVSFPRIISIEPMTPNAGHWFNGHD